MMSRTDVSASSSCCATIAASLRADLRDEPTEKHHPETGETAEEELGHTEGNEAVAASLPNSRRGLGGAQSTAASLPEQGPQHAAAIEREGGEEIEDAEQEVGHGQPHEARDHEIGHAGQSSEAGHGRKREGETEADHRADHGHSELVTRGLAVGPELRDATEQPKRYLIDLDPVPSGHQGMPELMSKE